VVTIFTNIIQQNKLMIDHTCQKIEINIKKDFATMQHSQQRFTL